MNFLNRVGFETSTTGTGSIAVGAALTGYASPADAGAVNATAYTWAIEDGDDFEIVRGDYSSSGPTIARDTVLLSKIGGSYGTTKLTLSGTAVVRCVAAAEDLDAFYREGATPEFAGLTIGGVPVLPGIPQNSHSANYTLALSDAQKHIYHPVSDDNARTFTIPANASVAFPVGTAITFINEINAITIAITSDTLVWAGDGGTGSRTLAASGVATAIKVTATRWIISGVELS